MPQVDLVSSCTGGVTSSHNNDRKIACETLADDDPPPHSNHPDLPPDSFFLTKEAELDWIDRNAFIERKESAKGGNSIPPVNVVPNTPTQNNPPSISGSQRYSLSAKSKPTSIIGLLKPQKTASYAESKNRRPVNIRLFPKRSQSSKSNSGRKSAVSVAEPSSPKVSCIGRVRSKRDRSRRKQTCHQNQSEPAIARSRSRKNKKQGFWSSFRSIFKSRSRKKLTHNEPVVVIEPPVADPPSLGAVRRFSSARRSDAWAADLQVECDKTEPSDRPIALGAVKRFSSGRRSDAWAGELESDVVKSELSDPPIALGTVKRFSSGRRSDAWAGELESDVVKSEPSDPPTIGGMKRFSSGRKSDAWATDLDGGGMKSAPSDPPSMGAVKRFSSGRRSDAWAADLEVEGTKI